MDKPLILITNDDGIHSDGILALQQSVQSLGETIVVAPEAEKSAVGHAITIADPIRIKEVERQGKFFGYAIGGTPADCVKLGVKVLLDRKPSLIVSGINLGSNLGTSILYSGTVSAAIEGVLLGIPSIAVSLDTFTDEEFSAASEIAHRFASLVLENGLPKGTALNINVPNVKKDEIKGVRVTKLGTSYYDETFDKREDPRGRIYYWMDGNLVGSEYSPDLDDIAVNENYVSVTPIHYKLTNHAYFETLSQWEPFINGKA